LREEVLLILQSRYLKTLKTNNQHSTWTFGLGFGGSMSKLKLTAFALATLCCFRIDLTAQPQAKETKAGTSTVSGRITLKEEPMRGVTVTLREQRPMMLPSDMATMPRARTDANGMFRITGVAPGRYLVSAAAPAYVSSERNSGFPQTSGRWLNVGENETIENIDIELKRGGVITGSITDSSGRPLVEEQVNLMRLDESGKPQYFYLNNFDSGSTDDRGIYRIYGLPEGRYLVSVGHSPDGTPSLRPYQSRYPRTYHPDTTDQSQAKAIEVGEGSEATGIDIVLGDAKKTYTIYGRVMHGETGQPVPGVQLHHSLISPDGRGGQSWSGFGEGTNAKGEFRLQGVAKGKYAVFARAGQGEDFYSEPAYCDVIDSDVHGVEVRIKQGGTLSGVVVIEGTNDPAVLAKLTQFQLYFYSRSEGVNGPGPSPFKVGPDGSFVVRGLRPGKVSLSPFIRTYTSMNEFTLLRIEHNGAPQADGITIGPGENITNVRVVVTHSVLRIRGEVKVVNGTLPGNLRLYVNTHRAQEQMMERGRQGGEVDQGGRFVIENLAPGEYELQVIPRFYPGTAQPDPRLSRAVGQVKQKVVVSSNNQPPITIVIDLSQQGGNQ
jgi:Carboxypeptidase regulatory-like domain